MLISEIDDEVCIDEILRWRDLLREASSWVDVFVTQ